MRVARCYSQEIPPDGMWRSDYGVFNLASLIAIQQVIPEEIEQNSFFCPDPDKVPEMEEYMAKLNRRVTLSAPITVIASKAGRTRRARV